MDDEIFGKNKTQMGGKKKGSKKSSKKASKKSVKKVVKKGSKKVHKGGVRAANPALIAYQGLISLIKKTLDVKGGPSVMSLSKVYNDKAKEKFPTMDPTKRIEEAKKLFLDDKANAKKKLDDIISKREAKKKVSRTKK